jgi:outer membrane lipoprotein-sorting protein
MTRNRFALAVLLVGAAALACAGGGGGKGRQSDPERARQLLLKTLERTFSHNVIALITQRSPENHGNTQRIQVQISRDGKMRQTVIYPLSMQGVETIDDGKNIATFFPDEKLVIVQSSPKLQPADTAARINLTIRNYSLHLGGSTNIAGHIATVVVATPRSRELETRRYHIDERTGFLLKLETIDKSGVIRPAFYAQQVIYPSKINASTFAIDLEARSDRKIIYNRPTSLTQAVKAPPKLNFEPVVPQALPYGFDVQDVQINENENFGSAAVRISDGLVKATVYQYSVSDAKKMKQMPGTTIDEGSGIKFVVAADVPESVRRRILAAFMEAAKRTSLGWPLLGLSPREELLAEIPALTPEEVWAIDMLLSVNFLAKPFDA